MSNPSNNSEIEFIQLITGVRKLKQDKIDIYQQTPRKKPVVNPDKDQLRPSTPFQSVSNNIPSTVQESWFHHGIQKKLQRKIRMGSLTTDGLLDLHGYTQQQAIRELELFIQYAEKTKARQLLIIHGKGFNSNSEAVLRPLVQHWLSEQTRVLAYCPAQPKDGGYGASYVYLKNT